MSTGTTPDLELERAAFEAVFSAPPYEFDMARYRENSPWPGNYCIYHVRCAWDAWQEARRALGSPNAWLIETGGLSGPEITMDKDRANLARTLGYAVTGLIKP